tara:strand:- start:18480 stop:19277 length:798 start_codon:yes stop_codon:yes gene_type:complete
MMMRVSALFLIVLTGVSILVPWLSGVDPNYVPLAQQLEPLPPRWSHWLYWFGTDDLGRGLLIRIVYGARLSLVIGVVSALLSTSIGSLVGGIAGYFGGWVDKTLMRFVEFMMAIPTLFLILIIQTIYTPTIVTVMIVIGVTSWMGVARLVRSEVLSIKQRPFVLAARARGISGVRLLFRHIMPHALPPIVVAATLDVGGAILIESALSFLGLGVQPPHASWGNMLHNSLAYLLDAPWMALIPGAFITATVVAINNVGDRLRYRSE